LNYNILCVDDVRTNLLTLSAIFESNSTNYNILTANSGKEAIKVLSNNEVDLILLDVVMPEQDGFETAKIIFQNDDIKHIPIIFLTAKQDDETIREAYEVGGVDYMNKPFNVVELLKRIEFHLKLKESEKLILTEKQQVQSLINLQDNFVILTNGERAIKINSATEEFFNVSSIDEFQKKYSCICKTFIKEDGFYSHDLTENEEEWVNDVIEILKNDDVLVKIKDTNNDDHIFTVKAVGFQDTLYILSFTDITSMSEQSREYKHEAMHDALTQIYNRNKFVSYINEKIKQKDIIDKKFSVCIFDIDFFKAVNDNYGHQVGDNVLKELTSLVKEHIRNDDVFARWGGEEFVIGFDLGIDEVFKKVEYLRSMIEVYKFDKAGSITCSFGVTEYIRGDSLDTLISRADNALYKAKEIGRNKVCCKPELSSD